MGRKHTKLHYHHGYLRELARGFSLVELMVALAIAGFLGIGLWALMQSQNKTYAMQDSTSQMQQNLRAAVDKISRDLLCAGQAPASWQMTINGQTTTWYVPATLTPYFSAANSNQLDIIECMPTQGNAAPPALSLAAATGNTQITLGAGQGAGFAVGAYLDVGDAWVGYESAKVTAIAGDVLTVDTNPNLAGNQGLATGYAPQTYVRPLQWVTYAVNNAVNPTQLTRDQHDGNGAQAIAYNITALVVQNLQNANPAATPPDGGLLQITVTGSTGGPNPVQSTMVNTIHLRMQ